MDIESIKNRQYELGDWLRGRSTHPFKDAKEHAANLAQWYIDDVRVLLQENDNLKQQLKAARETISIYQRRDARKWKYEQDHLDYEDDRR